MPAANFQVPPGLKVLVAEDNLISQRIVLALLGRLGHTAVVVNDGAKALRCLAGLDFDLVLMDVMMPVMDGLQALAHIRQQEALSGRHMPVIMATAQTEDQEIAQFMQAGADGYLSKPLEIEQLRRELEKVLPTARK